MTAVLARELGSVELAELSLRPPDRDEIVVRIDASGLCHSDRSVLDGTLPVRPPFVMGHEGAGVVVEAGDSVTTVGVGDRVVLAAIPTCGTCSFCAGGEPFLCARMGRMRRSGFRDEAGNAIGGLAGLGTFADAVTVPAAMAVPVHTDLPAEQLALLGCAVVTGAGAVFNTAPVRPGQRVAVIGAGGIGLSAVQAARAAGAAGIAALDPNPASLALARRCGATVTATDASELAAMSGDGGARPGRGQTGPVFDVVVDCVGTGATIGAAWSLCRRGGTIVVVGVAAATEVNPVPIVELALTGKRLVGCVYGSSHIYRDIPRLVALAESGRLDLAVMIGQRVSLEQVPGVFADTAPRPGRTVMVRTGASR